MRFYNKGSVYFITTNTEKKYPFFNEDIFCELLACEIEIASVLKQFITFGYVIIRDHIHLLLQPIGNYNISQIVHFIKRNSSRNINRLLSPKHISLAKNSMLLTQNPVGEVDQPRLQASENINSEVKQFEIYFQGLRKRFWNIRNSEYIKSIPTFQWHRSFYDHILRDNEKIERYYKYLLYNPLKHSIVDDISDYRWIFILESDDYIKPVSYK